MGLLTKAQLSAMGVSKNTIAYRVGKGLLEHILPGVLAVGGSPDCYRRDVMAATLWAGAGSAASGSSAAIEWGLDGFTPGDVEISSIAKKLGEPRVFRSGRKLIVHRVDRRLRNEIVKVGSLPVTSMPWTLLDLAGRKHRRLGRVIDRAIRDKLTNLGEIWLLYENEWIHGRRGVAILRNLLVERTEGIGASDSDLEELFWQIVSDFGLPNLTSQLEVVFSVGPGRIDFAYPELKIAIECDSVAWHLDREAFERDRLRDLELQAMGWVVLRFTWAKLKYEPHFVAEQVEHHLKQRSRTQPRAG